MDQGWQMDKKHRVWVVTNLRDEAKVGDAVAVRRADGSRTVVILGEITAGDDGRPVGIPARKVSIEDLVAASKAAGL